jgi:hypothetical protein
VCPTNGGSSVQKLATIFDLWMAELRRLRSGPWLTFDIPNNHQFIHKSKWNILDYL